MSTLTVQKWTRRAIICVSTKQLFSQTLATEQAHDLSQTT